jgi:hypothetical protein
LPPVLAALSHQRNIQWKKTRKEKEKNLAECFMPAFGCFTQHLQMPDCYEFMSINNLHQ